MGKLRFKNIAVLTSKESWFVRYARRFVKCLKTKGYRSRLFFNHRDVRGDFQIVFILNYYSLVNRKFLRGHRHNLVVHTSGLPKGKGWAPLFWQILEGRNRIPIVLFEATEKMDDGPIYIKDNIRLKGDEIYDEIRRLQAEKTVELCLRFLKDYKNLRPVMQRGKATYYSKRCPTHSKLSINKGIKEQFNLLRVVNNSDFPAYFVHKGQKYILKISKK